MIAHSASVNPIRSLVASEGRGADRRRQGRVVDQRQQVGDRDYAAQLQHRMKNNLQVIVSFLALQGRESASEEARERIGRVMDRVMAIGLAHDQLSFKKSASSVDMRDYLKALCANIDPCRPNITIDTEFESVSIPLDRAVPIGLILNEVVTNSVKYAFDEEGGVSSTSHSG
jgi:two-component sensor histidine kinase